ncbi:NAD(P)-dependent dehydrogenase (short-subunit alcohol dehydrogenase family) [Aliiruegeria haliotis]|uniref:NAD(P)-dependent dehydrogenase (Short-subunit alcohol dehydrogenase family) n=1 Tax=Aliiruegeria haliotis TaxID=1280846 RepID=A0A2T0RM45_9RHOB|nr:SDR family oxidoreductase [Aliiruegeria haliotis]PRY22259.1 NAD(P)-dependent dehydrogenase (short-subunit alcohol dehydrogenase family) [Aliiruegeria haliotis]
MTPNEIFDLSGRTALVTGSSRGIGEAIAEGLAGAGARVVTHATTLAGAERTADKIRAAGGQAEAVVLPLDGEGAGRELIETVEDKFGPVDILVINASAQINKPLGDMTRQDMEFQIAVNLVSTVDMLECCLPRMAERGWGRVVSIGSVNQLRPKPLVPVYAATKAAQHNLILGQARDYAARNVLLNTLAPGMVATPRHADRRAADPQGFDAYCKTLNWMGRSGRSEEMVGAALLLASDACSFMTGESITLSGGTD